tara:strand:+ start:521 stop:1312 length:792 start_codon:yes stop_codon:yes gene_type:complete
MKASTKIFGCIADPIDHVKAPSLFTQIFKEKNIDAVMIPINVSAINLEQFFSCIKSVNNFSGLTVTIPHKTKVLRYCDLLEKEANDTQSVNWIKIEKNKIIGTNFDGIGFTNGMKSNGFSISNKEFAIFGIGGAGSAICHSLLRNNVKKLKLINRNIEKLNNFVKKLNKLNYKTEILVDDFVNYDISNFDYVINATSLGLKENKDLIFDVKKTKLDATIIDIIMEPEETILIKEAKKYNRNYHLGKNMLSSQVDLAGKFFNLW